MSNHWNITREEGGIAILKFDRHEKNMNTLSEDVCQELNSKLDEITADSAITGLIISSGKKDFCAGADITEFAGIKTAEEERKWFERFSQSFKKYPTLNIRCCCHRWSSIGRRAGASSLL